MDASFTPVNSLEIRLRAMLTDKHTPSWNFYTPLAAAPLWVIIPNQPKRGGVAPKPLWVTFETEAGPVLGLYTAQCRVEAIFKKWKLDAKVYSWGCGDGWPLLKSILDPDFILCMNFGLTGCEYHLDPDMVEILLSRPEPKPEKRPSTNVLVGGEPEPHRFLDQVREFLSRQPNVRAAWVFELSEPPASRYDLLLLMRDPEDKSLIPHVKNMAKALTPVEMEWTVGVMVAEDRALRDLAAKQSPLYTAPDFLEA